MPRVFDWITARECEERFPGWLDSKGDAAWRLNGVPLLDPIISRFGGFEIRVLLIDGQPDHAKGIYAEAKNQNTIAWGVNKEGQRLYGCNEEVRPFADAPDGTKLIQTFFQPVAMGFFDKLLGQEGRSLRPVLESGNDAAIREAFEEMGITEIIDLSDIGPIWPNATNTSTVTSLYDMQVDLEQVIANPNGREWTIINCLWLSAEEILERIAKGSHGDVNCRMGQANASFVAGYTRHLQAFAS